MKYCLANLVTTWNDETLGCVHATQISSVTTYLLSYVLFALSCQVRVTKCQSVFFSDVIVWHNTSSYVVTFSKFVVLWHLRKYEADFQFALSLLFVMFFRLGLIGTLRRSLVIEIAHGILQIPYCLLCGGNCDMQMSMSTCKQHTHAMRKQQAQSQMNIVTKAKQIFFCYGIDLISIISYNCLGRNHANSCKFIHSMLMLMCDPSQ
jgi:hypothetical protein